MVKGALSMIADFTPVVGDIKSGVEGVQAARQGDMVGAGLGALGALPFVPNMAGAIGKVAKEAPRAEAMRIAQKNAAKPISEGGLGLKPDNTPMDRAKAMGFDIEAYHYTRATDPIAAFDPKTTGKGQYFFDGLGTHVGSKKAAEDRFSKYWKGLPAEKVTGYTMPLLVKGERTLTQKGGDPYKEGALNRFLEGKMSAAGYDLAKRPRDAQLAARQALNSKYDAVPYVNAVEDKGSLSYLVTNPANIRSRYAAFDPANAGKADIMGNADPRLLALIAGGGLLGVGLSQD
jgi:hypothetical protein